MVRSTRAVTGLAAAMLGLSACSGGEAPAPEPSQSADPTGSSSPAAGVANGELTLGGLLPLSGSSASLGAPQLAGLQLAIADINAADGVLGKPVRFVSVNGGDSQDNLAPGAVDELFAEQVDGIIGAASSSVTLTVLDKITAAGALLVSPSATAQELTSVADRDLFFRTAPSNTLQAEVLANEIAADGNERLGILASEDSYGRGLAASLQEGFERSGGDVPEAVFTSPDLDSYTSEVARLRTANPDAIALVSLSSAGTDRQIAELAAQGIGPGTKRIYLVDGNLADSYDLPAGTLQGVKGTLPGARPSAAFQARLLEQDPSLTHFSYAAEAYDAAVLIALAAEKTATDASARVAAELVSVSRDGKKCRAYAECRQLLAQSTDIDYDGVSGPISFDAAGDAAEAFIGIYVYNAANKRTFVRATLGALE